MRFWQLMDDMVADEHVPVGILKLLHFSVVWIDVAPTTGNSGKGLCCTAIITRESLADLLSHNVGGGMVFDMFGWSPSESTVEITNVISAQPAFNSTQSGNPELASLLQSWAISGLITSHRNLSDLITDSEFAQTGSDAFKDVNPDYIS
ncbi:hypothetical protein B0H14DRAFT_3159317 [Mycena olivaceomarginata]|nr:hypothetical protein B0H14DRAFT_3159317 [Mycena olivaceomarginata]